MWIGIIVTLLIGAAVFYIFANIYHHLDADKHDKNEPGVYTKIKNYFKIKLKPIRNKLKDMSVFKGIWSFQKNYFKPLKFWDKNKVTRRESIIDKLSRYHMFSKFGNSEGFRSEGMFLFDTVDNSLLYTYGMLALVSLPRFPTGWALRVMTGYWWLYCILIVVSYRASLTAILATPQPRVTINTVEELAASPVQCGGWGEQNKLFFTTSLDPPSQEIGQKFDVVKDPEATDAIARVAMGTFAYYGNIYFLRSARVKQSTNNQTDFTSSPAEVSKHHNLHIMSDCVINMPISLGLGKNSPLKPQVNKFIRQFIEAGLVKKWLNDVMMDTLIAEAPLAREEVKALVDLRKLYAGFIALFIGYAVSVVVLLAENVHWYFIVKKDPLFDKYFISKYYDGKKRLY